MAIIEYSGGGRQGILVILEDVEGKRRDGERWPWSLGSYVTEHQTKQ